MLKNIIKQKFLYHCSKLNSETMVHSFMNYKNENYLALKNMGKEIIPFVKECLSGDIDAEEKQQLPHPFYFCRLAADLLGEEMPQHSSVSTEHGMLKISVQDYANFCHDWLTSKGY